MRRFLDGSLARMDRRNNGRPDLCTAPSLVIWLVYNFRLVYNQPSYRGVTKKTNTLK